MPSANVLVLSPALPSELLTYILDHHVYPTTLIICSSRAEFLEALIKETRDQQPAPETRNNLLEENSDNLNTRPVVEHQQPPPPDPTIRLSDNDPTTTTPKQQHHHHPNLLLPSPLYQLSISRHIRTIYTPTVTHLRSYLAVFSPTTSSSSSSSISSPPPSSFRPPTARKQQQQQQQQQPHLILYGLVALHRDTSEWSAQGLGTTCAAVAETGRRLGWRIEVADPPPSSAASSPSPHEHPPISYEDGEENDDADADENGRRSSRNKIRSRGEEGLQELLREKLPILSGGVPLRPGLFDADEGGGWSGRAVEVGRVLSRWCQFSKGKWDEKLEDLGV